MLGGALAALFGLGVAGLAWMVALAVDTAPEMDVPEDGDDLLTWAAANPDATRCPDTPAEEGL
ncbi:hypothetical protein [Saccharothrix stipae]